MDYTQITQYGIIGALLIALAGMLIKSLPATIERVYNDRTKREQDERAERRDDHIQLVSLVKNNTEAMTNVSGAVDRLNDTVTFLSHDVTHIYTHLNLTRPERPEEGLILPPHSGH